MGKKELRELRKVADLLDGIHDELIDLGESLDQLLDEPTEVIYVSKEILEIGPDDCDEDCEVECDDTSECECGCNL